MGEKMAVQISGQIPIKEINPAAKRTDFSGLLEPKKIMVLTYKAKEELAGILKSMASLKATRRGETDKTVGKEDIVALKEKFVELAGFLDGLLSQKEWGPDTAFKLSVNDSAPAPGYKPNIMLDVDVKKYGADIFNLRIGWFPRIQMNYEISINIAITGGNFPASKLNIEESQLLPVMIDYIERLMVCGA